MAPSLSIIVPVFNEKDSLHELYRQILPSVETCIASGQIRSFEIWFVSDGSTDGSIETIQSLSDDDPRVGLIALRRNFGKAAALQAGFRHANGDIVITMDADLQDDPKEIPRFLDKLSEGYDVVSGWKKKRYDPLSKRLPSKLFNAVTSRMSGVKLHDFNCGFKAYRKEVVESIDLYGELHRYIPVLAARSGFRIAELVVEHHERKHGKSKYGMERYLRGLFDSMTTSFLLKYYDRPMNFFGRIGLYSFFAGFIICLILTVEWLCGYSIGGRPLLMLGILLILIGVQFFATGFIGNMIVESNFRCNYSESHIGLIRPVRQNKDSNSAA
ncbi:MAG: glycosyltransferase family 2 protein [Clostridiales bacterium]|nr:glycosyltransferase family 2 protein [Clostridiales bacterium]